MFIKALPQKVSLAQKDDLQVTCVTGSMTEESVEGIRRRIDEDSKNIRKGWFLIKMNF
jgi:hypothetical protein